jgi:preprotein translocase subunit SecF
VAVAVEVAVAVGVGATTVIGTLTGWLSTVTVATALLLLVELKVELSMPEVTVPLVGFIVPLVAL